MLNKARTLKGYKLHSLDGEIGTVKEFFFDDRHWIVRYLVVDTGGWLTGPQVLLSPYALVDVIQEDQHIAVNLTKKQIEESPSWDSDKPVSRQYETDYYGYYGWPMYWNGQYAWGAYPGLVRDQQNWTETTRDQKAWDCHLRSTDDVDGHHIQAADGEIGHVEDFIVDDETWAVRYLIVNTRNWWPGKKVLIAPSWIERVSWSEKKVFVNLSRAAIRQSPEYTEDSRLTRDYETGLHQHYQREGYWAKELAGREVYL
jgi:hypothetical protein